LDSSLEAVTIRSAEPHRDAAACAAIYAPFVEETAVSFETVAPGPAEFVERIVSTTATHPWLVAERDGEAVAYAYACRHRERAAYRWAADVAVYVAEEERRRGHGTALYVELLARMRRQGFRVACAGITLPNEASIALHERLGFVPVGVYRRIGWKAGAWRDVGWWQLDLGPVGEADPPRGLPWADG
jgi:phosphinothricin acetyltransferase